MGKALAYALAKNEHRFVGCFSVVKRKDADPKTLVSFRTYKDALYFFRRYVKRKNHRGEKMRKKCARKTGIVFHGSCQCPLKLDVSYVPSQRRHVVVDPKRDQLLYIQEGFMIE